MRNRTVASAVFAAAAAAVCAVATTRAQEASAGPPIPTLSFRLVENFFHYPAYSVIGRLSGVAVSPTGNIVAFLDSPEQSARGIPMSEVTLEGDQFSMVVPAAQASYRGTLGADTIEGTWAQGNISGAVTMTRGEYTPTVTALEVPGEAWARLRGTWRGPLSAPGGTLEVVLRFETTADGVNAGYLDIPARGAAGPVTSGQSWRD